MQISKRTIYLAYDYILREEIDEESFPWKVIPVADLK